MGKMLLSNINYSLVLNLLHKIYTLFYIFYNLCGYVRRTIINFFSHETFLKDYHQCLDHKFKGLNKVPHHLALILGPEEPSYKDLVNIVIWCTASGIPFLTLYDHKGLLKKSEDKFYEKLSETSGLTLSNGVWTKYEKPYNGYKNAFVRKIKINILSLIDGQHSIIETTKQLISEGVKSQDITIDKIDKYLSDKLDNMKDPDLAVYCGDLCATYGFLPWQVRITEFINLKTHRDVRLQEFIKLLQFYSHCEQRYGK